MEITLSLVDMMTIHSKLFQYLPFTTFDKVSVKCYVQIDTQNYMTLSKFQ